MSIVKKVETRKFLGKTENFTDNQERKFFNRMLRAYLKGATHFAFGRTFNHLRGQYEPIIHVVEQA